MKYKILYTCTTWLVFVNNGTDPIIYSWCRTTFSLLVQIHNFFFVYIGATKLECQLLELIT